MSFFSIPSVATLTHDGGVLPRMLYHFFHANFLHALCNVWCLLALVFYYHIRWPEFALAWAVAALVPAFCITAPTVGLSGICFALMGIVFPRVARKGLYLSWMAGFLALGFLFPAVAAVLHLWCFAIGCAVGYIYSKQWIR